MPWRSSLAAAGDLVGTEPPTGIVLPVEIFRGAAIRKEDFEAATLGDDLVFDQADAHGPRLLGVAPVAAAPHRSSSGASAASFCHSGSYRVTQPVQRCHNRSMG